MRAFARRLADSLFSLAVTLWVGGLWAIGFIAAPSLFASLKDRVLAGELAGNLFSLIAWVGMACAAYLLAYLAVRRGRAVFKSGAFWLVLAMLILGLVGHFGIQPAIIQLKAEAGSISLMDSALKDRFLMWHGVASAIYMIQGFLGGVLACLTFRLS